MDKPTTSLIGCIFFLLGIIVASCYFNNHGGNIYVERLNISASTLLRHVSTIMAFGDADTYEAGRNEAREYIKSTLIKGGIPQENIFWHYFEWKEKQQGSSLLWSGVNILVWTNSTAIPNQKVRIVSAHYDTLNWGKNSTAGASSLTGVALLMETAVSLYQYQQNHKKSNASFAEVPYLFIFFDHYEPGALGSKVLANELPPSNIAYFIAIGSVGFQGSFPILHTFPHDHMRQSFYTPDWLASLLLRAGTSQNVSLKIGSDSKTRSLLYQAYRYHWHAVSHMGDDGPFAWQGVPSALLTDYDPIFEPSPHHLQITDQISTLKEKRITDFSKIFSAFLLASQNHSKMSYSEDEFVSNIFTDILYFMFNGIHQYLGVGPFIFGFVETASLSFVIISVVCFNSVYQYQKVYTYEHSEFKTMSDSEFSADSEDDIPKLKRSFELSPPENDGFWQGHKILVVHMLLMSAAVIVDTVFAFEILILSFAALSTIHFSLFYINIITGFVSSILCANFLYKDVIIMARFGIRTRDLRELRLVALIIVYFLHSVLLLVYGYDYRRKAKLKKN